jgi:hypothetical protein
MHLCSTVPGPSSRPWWASPAPWFKNWTSGGTTPSWRSWWQPCSWPCSCPSPPSQSWSASTVPCARCCWSGGTTASWRSWWPQCRWPCSSPTSPSSYSYQDTISISRYHFIQAQCLSSEFRKFSKIISLNIVWPHPFNTFNP